MSIYPTIAELAAAVDTHFSRTEMPALVECRAAPGGYEFVDARDRVPYAVAEPEGYKGDDEMWYWGPESTSFINPLVIDGYHVTGMHSSETTSPKFVEHHLGGIDDGPIVLGCVIVSFSVDDEDDDNLEWAWVVGG